MRWFYSPVFQCLYLEISGIKKVVSNILKPACYNSARNSEFRHKFTGLGKSNAVIIFKYEKIPDLVKIKFSKNVKYVQSIYDF